MFMESPLKHALSRSAETEAASPAVAGTASTPARRGRSPPLHRRLRRHAVGSPAADGRARSRRAGGARPGRGASVARQGLDRCGPHGRPDGRRCRGAGRGRLRRPRRRRGRGSGTTRRAQGASATRWPGWRRTGHLMRDVGLESDGGCGACSTRPTGGGDSVEARCRTVGPTYRHSVSRARAQRRSDLRRPHLFRAPRYRTAGPTYSGSRPAPPPRAPASPSATSSASALGQQVVEGAAMHLFLADLQEDRHRERETFEQRLVDDPPADPAEHRPQPADVGQNRGRRRRGWRAAPRGPAHARRRTS